MIGGPYCPFRTAVVDRSFSSDEDLPMAGGASRDRGRTWSVLAGAVVGVAIGILISVTTDVPFAPEAGLLVGGLAGWFAAGWLRR
jgi:hypothetical protein